MAIRRPTVEGALKRELRLLDLAVPGRAWSSSAVTALVLARKLDDPELRGPAAAACAKELEAVKARLWEGVAGAEERPLDDLRARRASRRSVA